MLFKETKKKFSQHTMLLRDVMCTEALLTSIFHDMQLSDKTIIAL